LEVAIRNSIDESHPYDVIESFDEIKNFNGISMIISFELG